MKRFLFLLPCLFLACLILFFIGSNHLLACGKNAAGCSMHGGQAAAQTQEHAAGGCMHNKGQEAGAAAAGGAGGCMMHDKDHQMGGAEHGAMKDCCGCCMAGDADSKDADAAIPEKLVPPKDKEWTETLQKACALEKCAVAQFEADSKKHNLSCPYKVAIPQGKNHVELLSKLASACGVPADAVAPAAVKETAGSVEAYQVAVDIEKNLVPACQALIKEVDDQQVKKALDTILKQDEALAKMFTYHAGSNGKEQKCACCQGPEKPEAAQP